MNILAHFLFNTLVISQFFDIEGIILPIFLFSVFLDLDHIPYIAKNRRNVLKSMFNPNARTRLHEFYGLFLFSAILAPLYFLTSNIIFLIALLCIILHILLDFATGKSRPFHPYSSREFFVIDTRQKRIIAELGLTLLLVGYFLLK